ncbi:Uncharacterised protein [Mycobacteroides abscessus subsp. abscessus]|nr:Uncharacterised protein [Mycobacteroides abscessus subsp. abscessus]
MLRGHVDKAAPVHDPGIVDKQIRCAELGIGPFAERLPLLFVRDVQLIRRRPASGGDYLVGRGLGSVDIDIRQHNPVASRGKQTCGFSPDTGPGAGDDRCFHRFPPIPKVVSARELTSTARSASDICAMPRAPRISPGDSR